MLGIHIHRGVVDNSPHRMQRFALLVISFGLFLSTSVNLYAAAQDYIKDNPELDRLLGDSSPRDRDALNKMLSSMQPEDRQKFIQGMIELRLNSEKNDIIVERVFAKFHGANQKGLTVTNGLPSTGEPLTTSELAALEKLPLNGVLEIVQLGKGGVKGAKKQVRIVLIIQKPVDRPVKFPLPDEGSLMIVQMDDGWAFLPKDYTSSNKSIVIKPGRPNKTDVEWDNTGSGGYTGSEVYAWDP
jgi:hypothetical protein